MQPSSSARAVLRVRTRRIHRHRLWCQRLAFQPTCESRVWETAAKGEKQRDQFAFTLMSGFEEKDHKDNDHSPTVLGDLKHVIEVQKVEFENVLAQLKNLPTVEQLNVTA